MVRTIYKKDSSGKIRFFEYTDGGLPRFPICYGFRSTFEK